MKLSKKILVRFLVLVIALPALAGVITYVTETMKDPTYKASAKLELGSFDEKRFSNPLYSSSVIASTAFLNAAAKLYGLSEDVESVHSRLTATPKDGMFVLVELKGTDEKNTQKDLEAITNTFVRINTNEFNNRQGIITSVNGSLEKTLPTDEDYFDTQKLRYESQIQGLDWKNAKIVEPVVTENASNVMTKSLVAAFLAAALVVLGFFGFLLLRTRVTIE